MLSNILDRISFWALFCVVVLLPVFFLPFSKIPVETSKGLLLVLGLVVSIIFYAAARFSDGKITVPKSYVLLSGLGVVFAFFVSAIFSGASKMSFFGIMFDIGTFWFVFSGYLLMLMSSVVLKDKNNARKVLFGVLISSAIVFVFQVARLFMPETLSLGVLGGKIDNLVGSWNSFGLLAGLVIVLSLFVIEFNSVSKKMKMVFGSLIAFSILMAILVNFPLVWKVVGIFALFVFVYKISSFANRDGEDRKKIFPVLSFSVVIISLLFFMSGAYIGGYVPSKLGLSNLEVSPSLGATMQVSIDALKKSPVIGIGANRFEEVWSMYKPAVINNTQFWNTSFVTGSGLLPTFISTTGILGVLALLAFIVSLIISGIKNLFMNIKRNENFETSLFFIASLFLLFSMIFYSTGVVLFLLFFVFTGIFIGLSSANRENGEYTISFLEDPRKSFFFILFLVLLMIVSAGLSFKYIERFASVHYFGKAVLAQDEDQASSAITRALVLHQNDLYFRTYSQVYLARLNVLAEKAKTGELTESEKTDIQNYYNEAVNGATLATEYNPKSYLNWEMLGSVYYSVSLIGLADAYDKQIEAYQKALTLNPLNPGLKFTIARAYLAQGKTKEAKDMLQEALNLKPNYTDALIVMSQLAKNEGKNAEALSYAQAALQSAPNDKDLIQYVNSFGNNPTPAPAPSEDENTTEE